ncbi:MAG: hypothetical protein ACYCPS_02555 [Candidatus Saccharimonadales bacterium]
MTTEAVNGQPTPEGAVPNSFVVAERVVNPLEIARRLGNVVKYLMYDEKPVLPN